MTKLRLLILSLLLGISNSGIFAQKSKLPVANSLLWRISGKNLAKPSYLFGTMHLICPDDYLWTESMKKSLEVSEKVCFEMDIDDPKVLMQITTGLVDTAGKKLEEYFTAAQYKLLKQYARDSFGVNINMFQQMKPVALQAMMTKNGIACNNPVSYEDKLMTAARYSNKEILGLEDPKEQIEVLEKIPVDTIINELMAMIQGTEKSDTEYLQLTSAYKAQDISALYRLITSAKDLGDMAEFLDGRNKKWIPRMADKMERSSVFFAVGAGHLWGESGVIYLLMKNGYTVEPAS